MNIQTRPATTDDVSDIVSVDKAVWGKTGADHKMVTQRICNFPLGTAVCLADGKIVGFGCAMQLHELPDNFTWDSLTEYGTINNHCPDGTLFYGVNLTALPQVSPNIGSAIFEYAFGLAIEKGCHRFLIGSRIPGFSSWLEKNQGKDVTDYVTLNGNGKSRDPELRLYQSAGFEIGHVIPNYFPDPASKDYGVLVHKDLC